MAATKKYVNGYTETLVPLTNSGDNKIKMEVFIDEGGLWRFRTVFVGNKKKGSTSGESFHDKHNAIRAARNYYSAFSGGIVKLVIIE